MAAPTSAYTAPPPYYAPQGAYAPAAPQSAYAPPGAYAPAAPTAPVSGMDAHKLSVAHEAIRRFKSSRFNAGTELPIAFYSPFGGCCGTSTRPPAQPGVCCACVDKFAHLETTWASPFCSAMCADPKFCCYAAFCSCCVAYDHRLTIIGGDIKRYTCCAFSSRCLDKCLFVDSCPACCLCMEVTCCHNLSIIINRDLIQQTHSVRSTNWDKCLVCLAVCCSGTRVSVNDGSAAGGGGNQDNRHHSLPCNPIAVALFACMQTQHEIELRTQPHADTSSEKLTHGHHGARA